MESQLLGWLSLGLFLAHQVFPLAVMGIDCSMGGVAGLGRA
jgi:hypothetical protein